MMGLYVRNVRGVAVANAGGDSLGFSLVELMVGVVISLIGTLAMLSAFAQFEAQKRRTTSGNDAQENGSFAVYELERVIRTAGSGMIQGKNYNVPGCTLISTLGGIARLPIPTALPSPFSSFPLAVQAIPVLIQSGGGSAGATNPDTIAAISGNPGLRVFQATVQGTTTSTSLVVDNDIGIDAGDYMLGAPNGAGCVLGLLGTNTSSLPPTYAVSPTNVPLNGYVGTPNVFDMGPNPSLVLYGVDTTSVPNTLMRYDMLSGSQAGVADGIVMVKALYGVDDGVTTPTIPGSGTADDDALDEWVQPIGSWSYTALMAGTPSAATAISQIKAIRVVVVAQSELPERASEYSGPSKLDLFADLGPLKYTMTLSSQFRYKVYDVTIPIRNAFVTRYF